MISEEDIKKEYLVHAKLKRKTPGWDGIPAVAIAREFHACHDYVLQKDLVNDCFHLEYFSKEWKLDFVKTILKAPGKDPSIPKSYRPMAFLPELGKFFERPIRKKIMQQ